MVICGLAAAHGLQLDTLDQRLDQLAPQLPRERLVQPVTERAEEIANGSKLVFPLALVQEIGLDALHLVPSGRS